MYMRSIKFFLFAVTIIVGSVWGASSTVFAQEIPPNQPSNISPTNLAVDVSLTTELIGFTYSHTENISHTASRWRITTILGNYTGPVFDSQEDTENLLSIAVPEGTLENATMYYWQLSHKDADGNWSSFSDETLFTTIALETSEEEGEESEMSEEAESESSAGSNLLIRLDDDTRIYYVTESGMKRHIPNPEVFVSYGNRWVDIEIVSQETFDSFEDNQYIHLDGSSIVYKLEDGKKRLVENFETQGIVWEQVAPINHVEYNFYLDGEVIEAELELIEGELTLAEPLQDGDIIRASGSDEIYIVKLAAGKKYKRHIFTPEIFDLYGHLSWDNVKIVPLDILDVFVTSTILQVEYQLNGKERDPRLWSTEVNNNSAILHPIDASAFSLEKNGWAPDSIFQITALEFNAPFYTQGETIVKNPARPTVGPCGDHGDVTGDGVITHGDVVKLFIEANQSEQSELVTSRGDINNDSRITSADSDMLNDYLNGGRTSFPVCES